MSNNKRAVGSEGFLSDKSYTRLRNAVQLVFPGVGSLYFGLSRFLELPASEEIVGTMVIFALLSGLILRSSTKRYKESDSAYDGKLVVTEGDAGTKVFSLELVTFPEEMQFMDTITFKVEK